MSRKKEGDRPQNVRFVIYDRKITKRWYMINSLCFMKFPLDRLGITILHLNNIGYNCPLYLYALWYWESVWLLLSMPPLPQSLSTPQRVPPPQQPVRQVSPSTDHLIQIVSLQQHTSGYGSLIRDHVLMEANFTMEEYVQM